MTESTAPLQVNGEYWPWQPGLHIAQILHQMNTPPHSVATALNGQFVARDARETTVLKPGDALTVFKAIVGG